MLHTRDAQRYPLHGVDVVPERPKPKPKPKYPLRDLVKLRQEAKQREEEADRRAEHWHRAYNVQSQKKKLKDRDLSSSCQRDNDETEAGETVELCHECSTGRDTRKSLELKLDKVYLDLKYWQECYETLLSEQQRDRKKEKKTPLE